MIAMIVMLAVLVLAVGNFAAVKPKADEMALDTWRMQARNLALNPKLIVRPDWLPPANAPQSSLAHTPQKKGMIAQYTLINDAWQLPQTTFWTKDGKWQWQNARPDSTKKSPLDNAAIDLPTLEPYIVALATKSNSVMIFWHDDKYVKTQMPNPETMLSELTTLKQQLTAWGNKSL